MKNLEKFSNLPIVMKTIIYFSGFFESYIALSGNFGNHLYQKEMLIISIVFPFIVFALFGYLVVKKPGNLYGPSD